MSRQTEMESSFHKAMVSHLEKAKKIAKVVSTRLLEEVGEKGALQVAREQLQSRFDHFDFPHRYFLALANRKRLDLTTETLILRPLWQNLFSKDEREIARARLEKYGYTLSAAEVQEKLPQEAEQGIAPIPEEQRSKGDVEGLALRIELLQLGPCEQLARLDEKLKTGLKFFAAAEHRDHLETCAACRRRFPRLLREYEQFDDLQINILKDLLPQLRTALHKAFGDELAKRLALESWMDFPEEYQGEEEASGVEWDHLQDEARELVAGRAALLGAYAGAIMDRYSQTHIVTGDPWVEWRNGCGSERVSLFVTKLDQDEYLAALIAKHVYQVFSISRELRVLTVPSVGDVRPIPDVLDVEQISDSEEWEELLNYEWERLLGNTTAPKLNFLNLLLLAAEAEGTVETRDQQPVQSTSGPNLKKDLSEIKERLESVQALQMPEIELLERIAAQMDKTSRPKIEEALRSIMGPTYQELHPKARASILDAEQIHRTEELAKPSIIVFLLAQAFEVQLKSSFLYKLQRYLLNKGIQDFPPTDKLGPALEPILRQGKPCSRLTLGNIQMALKSEQLELQTFCQLYGADLGILLVTIEKVRCIRNEAAHGGEFPAWRIDSIREEWLGINKGDGGIFRLLSLKKM